MRIYLNSCTILLCLLSGSLVAQAATSPSITINPGYTTIGVGGTVQYKATVTGLTNTAVTWEVNGVPAGNSTNGTISTSGLYKAPATIPTGNSGITVIALGFDKKTMGVVYINVAPVGPSIASITPNPIPTGTYNITLSGTGFKSGAIVRNGAVNLSTTFVNATTLKANGYQSFTQAGSFQVENPSTLWGPSLSVPFKFTSGGTTTQQISPLTASVDLGQSQQFTSSGATGWTATAGTISSSGLYTAPNAIPSSPAVTVTATGPNGSASATITLTNVTPQTIVPTSATLALNATQQFTSAGATTWSAHYGTITPTGIYTAPATLPTSSADTVTVTGSNGSATASVTLLPPMPVISGAGTNGQLPLDIFTATVTGSGFIGTSFASLSGTALSSSYSAGALTISGFASQSGPASLTVSNGSTTSQPFQVQVGVANAQVGSAAARRFLEQAAFGPTPTDAAHVQTIGFQPWILEQFNMAQISNYSSVTGDQGGMPAHFLTNAVSNPDQLRQRVAFALSQIFVTSIDKLIWNANMVTYQNMLLADAFSNYRQIMADVTLSPAMGQYLDMANNAMADPATGSVANENYARELMQLFIIGTNMLNQDGTLQHDSNNLPIPTYSQFTVTEFARAYTGWTYAPPPGQAVQWGSYISGYGPMVPYAPEHDSGSKQLLNGYVSPAGITPLQDLNNALDNVFNHPNIGPFVATQLIQHLVKSNPSPGYVSLVAAAFNDNGSGVRGDMLAIVTAILMDPEARANDNGGNDLVADGHLQEPALFLAGMVRAFGGQMNDQNYYASELADMGQDLFSSASVFNYYALNYSVPGTNLLGGEFQIFSPNNAIVRANEVSSLFSQYSNPVQSYGPGTSVDLTAFLPLASNPATLVSALDLTLTHGIMPSAMRSTIATAVTADNLGSLHRVQTACYLILTSNYYNVWH